MTANSVPKSAQPVRSPSGGTQAVRFGVSEPWALAPADVAEQLGVDPALGLSSSAARERLEAVGENALDDHGPESAFRQFARQFVDVTVIALIVAAVLAAILGIYEEGAETLLERFGDAAAIGIIVLLNAVVGFVQERKAERALRALRALGAPDAMVVREGAEQRVPSPKLVPGDVVLIREGSRVPADLRVLCAESLEAAEAALTGESQPVSKSVEAVAGDTPLAERSCMAFMGTHAARGGGRGIVVATGMDTELGKIAGMLGGVESPETPLQASLRRFGTYVVIGCAIVGAVVFAVGLIQLDVSVGFLVLTAVSLAVAAIPEGLPAVTTIVLALGVQRMAKKNALVRRLAAVETLGCANVVCTDKTGTLTQNRMTARRLWTAGRCLRVDASNAGQLLLSESGEREHPGFSAGDPVGELIEACGFAPAARITRNDDGHDAATGDPTDAALLSLHHAMLPPKDRAPSRFETVRVLAFDRQRRLSTVIARRGDSIQSFTHGAPEAVLARLKRWLGPEGVAELTDDDRRAIENQVENWAAEGLRVLALAGVTEDADASSQDSDFDASAALEERFERGMTLIGLVGLADPPRPEVPSALRRAARAGVRTVMITGDHPRTAEAIAREIGMVDEDLGARAVVTGPELDEMSDSELRQRAPEIRVVARATAQNKLRLVEALRAGGHVVAMTGDGVNDAPAIKAASIGVAMGKSGTDVTREAADMVLLDDDYATIVTAIEEGRIIYGNIQRFIVFLFAVNTGLVISVFAAALFGWPPILTPTQILWINLITNGLPALALGMEPVQLDPMRDPPRAPDAPILGRSELIWLGTYGALMAVLGLAVFAVYSAQAVDAAGLARARTATFTVLALSPLFHALNSRSRWDSVFTLGLFANWRLLGAFAAALALQAVAVYVPALERVFGTAPLDARDALILLCLSALVWGVGEMEKLLIGRLRPNQKAQSDG